MVTDVMELTEEQRAELRRITAGCSEDVVYCVLLSMFRENGASMRDAARLAESELNDGTDA